MGVLVLRHCLHRILSEEIVITLCQKQSLHFPYSQLLMIVPSRTCSGVLGHASFLLPPHAQSFFLTEFFLDIFSCLCCDQFAIAHKKLLDFAHLREVHERSFFLETKTTEKNIPTMKLSLLFKLNVSKTLVSLTFEDGMVWFEYILAALLAWLLYNQCDEVKDV